MVYDPRTNAYIDRHETEGLTKKEAVCCLKRYVAREVFNLLPHEKLGLDSPSEHRTGLHRNARPVALAARERPYRDPECHWWDPSQIRSWVLPVIR